MEGTRVPNIGASGRRRRLIGAGVWLILGAAATAVLVRSRASVWWYLVLVVPFTLAGLGYFQSRAHT